mgnify:FL=1
MNESYVLKTKSGAACGYIMARDEKLRIRLNADGTDMQLTVLYEDEEQTFSCNADGLEIEKPGRRKKLLGAYGTAGEQLAADTGEAARKAFEIRKTEAKREQKIHRLHTAQPVQENPEQETQKTKTAERRWPPPPCMPGAKYAKGSWRITEKGAR